MPTRELAIDDCTWSPLADPTDSGAFAPAANADSEVIELPLLLPMWQVTALEAAARESGMTVGQYLRRVLARVLPRS